MPGRGNLQPVGAVDRIGDVEHRRQRPRNRLAILDLHRSVGPFRHDLDGAAGFAGNLDPHQPVAHALQHRPRHRRHPRRHARLDDETRLGKQVGIHGTSSWIGHVQGQKRSYLHGFRPGLNRRSGRLPEPRPVALLGRARSGNKKERVPGGPLSIRDRMRTISCRGYSGFSAIRQGPRVPLRHDFAELSARRSNLTLHSRSAA